MSSHPNINSLLANVPKLNGDNYHDWKFAMSMVLRRAGCWEVVSGETKKPTTRDGLAEWEKKAEEGFTAIGLTIEPSQYNYLRTCVSGVDAWGSLCNIYEKNSRATRISLKRQFYGYHHEISRPIRTYLAEITALGQRLRAIGVELSDEDLVDVIIYNLDEEYSSIAATLAASKDDLKVTDVTSALLDEESRKQLHDPGVPKREIALYASRRRTLECWNCGKTGHRQSQCRAPKKTEPAAQANVAEDFSFSCQDFAF
ncbi:hypothetical protein ONZ45_g14517 [Pleurotus djamor]|nr:hypothetical protein ONZ45_g14517 [Pleurotus djamor]